MSGQGDASAAAGADASAAAGAFGLSLSIYLSIYLSLSVCLMRLVDAHLCRMETVSESTPSAGSAMEVSGDAGGAVPSHKRQASSNEALEEMTRQLKEELENERALRETEVAKERALRKAEVAKEREERAKAEQRAAKLETELKVEKRVGACFGRQCGGVGLLTRCVRVRPFLQVGCRSRVEVNYSLKRHNCTSTCCSTSRMKRILQ
jgi:hypothetical protein